MPSPPTINHVAPRNWGSTPLDDAGQITADGTISLANDSLAPTEVWAHLYPTKGGLPISPHPSALHQLGTGDAWSFSFANTIPGDDYRLVVSAANANGKSVDEIVFKVGG